MYCNKKQGHLPEFKLDGLIVPIHESEVKFEEDFIDTTVQARSISLPEDAMKCSSYATESNGPFLLTPQHWFPWAHLAAGIWARWGISSVCGCCSRWSLIQSHACLRQWKLQVQNSGSFWHEVKGLHQGATAWNVNSHDWQFVALENVYSIVSKEGSVQDGTGWSNSILSEGKRGYNDTENWNGIDSLSLHSCSWYYHSFPCNTNSTAY